jgi:hypothetical protein
MTQSSEIQSFHINNIDRYFKNQTPSSSGNNSKEFYVDSLFPHDCRSLSSSMNKIKNDIRQASIRR